MVRTAANYNRHDDAYSQAFLAQNQKQYWLPEEISITADKNPFALLSPEEQQTFMRVLGGLTLLDTEQGSEGMPLLSIHIKGFQRKAVLAFEAMMEHIHAKSYSNIFMTLATDEEIDAIFEWVETNPYLQRKAEIISEQYMRLLTRNPTQLELYMAAVTTVYNESFLFYSGFYYPLYLAGQGKMTASGETINLILRDESIHGVYGGTLAQEIFEEMSPEDQAIAIEAHEALFNELYENEVKYTEDLYSDIGIVEDVLKFVRYNGNKACMNIGMKPPFENEPINAIVENGLKTDTKNHDFFSLKGNAYVKALNVEPIEDQDFIFEWLEGESV